MCYLNNKSIDLNIGWTCGGSMRSTFTSKSMGFTLKKENIAGLSDFSWHSIPTTFIFF